MRIHRRTDAAPRDTIVYLVRFNGTLKPGLTASAYLVKLLPAGTYYEQTTDEVTVFDARSCNFYIPGEYGETLYDGETDRFIPVGSYGLLRRAKVTISPIASGGTGTANIVSNNGAVIAVANTSVKYRWADNAPTLAVGTEVWVQYLTDDQNWEVVPSGDGGGGSDSQAIVRITSEYNDCVEVSEHERCFWNGKTQIYADPVPTPPLLSNFCGTNQWSDGADVYLIGLGHCPNSTYLKAGERYIGRKLGSWDGPDGIRDLYAIEDVYRMVLWEFEANEAPPVGNDFDADLTSIGTGVTLNGVDVTDPAGAHGIEKFDKGLCLQITDTKFIVISSDKPKFFHFKLNEDMQYDATDKYYYANANHYELGDFDLQTSLGTRIVLDVTRNFQGHYTGETGTAICRRDADGVEKLYILQMKMKSQGDSVRVKPNTVLQPGGSVEASVYEWSGSAWVDDVGNDITIHDEKTANCVYTSEFVDVILNAESSQYEIVGSHGLTRRAVANATIAIDSSGSSLFKTTGGATAFTADAHLKWMHGGEQVSNGSEMLCLYLTDEQYWLIIGAECEA